MKKIYKFYFVVAVLLAAAFHLSAQVNGTATSPVVSTLTNPVWYYIESAANGIVTTSGNGINALGKVVYPSATNNAKMNYGAIPATKDNALWAFINDNGTIKAVNKGNGWYINNSHSAGTTQAGIEFALINSTTKQYTIFSDGVSSQSRMLVWNNSTMDRWSSSQGADGMEAFYFILPNTDVDLAIANATNILNTFSAEGAQPGQYTAASRATLQTAINDATSVRDNVAATQAEKDAAAATLSAAIDTYRSSRVKLATDGSKWYFIKGQRGSTATALFAENQGVGNQVLNKEQTFVNAQAWKIVPNGTGFALVNKNDNSFLNSDLGTASTATTNLSTIAAVPARALAIYGRGQDATSVDYFHVENKIPEPSSAASSSTIFFRLHAGSAGNNWGLVNYVQNATTGGMYDNTKYQFIEAPVTADPTNVPASGSTVSDGTTITVSDATADAVIYYTTDGTEPTAASASVASGGTITVSATSGTFTLKTMSVAPNSFPSNTITSTYAIKLNAPVITPAGATGIAAATQTVTIAPAESVTGVQIYYTTDGSTPTTASNLYTAPFDITHNTTVKAVAIATGYADSDVASADFKFSDIAWIGNSFVAVGGTAGTWYEAMDNVNSTLAAFNGANLGDFSTSITIGGEVQVWTMTAEGVSMGYSIDGGAATYVTLPKTGTEGNNSKHYAETTIDLSALSAGAHTIAVWYKAERDGVTLWDSNNSANYVANFNKTATGVEKNGSQSFLVRVSKGVVTVDGAEQFEVYSMLGQKQNPSRQLKQGAYIVKINDFTQKIIVQ